MNPYESGERKLIPAVLIYPRASDRFLMLHRNPANSERAARDYHLGKWNGLGGKFEPGESPLQCARRELSEEAAINVEGRHFKCLGNLLFPNFKAHKNEDWLVYVFIVDLPEGLETRFQASDEGSLEWVPASDILKLNLWEGDQHFIPYVLRREAFMGTIWYEGQRVVRHDIQPL